VIRLRSREAAVISQPRERTPLSARMVSRSKLDKLAIFARAAQQFRTPRDFLSTKGWIWKASVAGLCGSVTHTLLVIGKTELGLLESFQPYQSLQLRLVTGPDRISTPSCPDLFPTSTARRQLASPLPIYIDTCPEPASAGS
jgi:hypothetical protein